MVNKINKEAIAIKNKNGFIKTKKQNKNRQTQKRNTLKFWEVY